MGNALNTHTHSSSQIISQRVLQNSNYSKTEKQVTYCLPQAD